MSEDEIKDINTSDSRCSSPPAVVADQHDDASSDDEEIDNFDGAARRRGTTSTRKNKVCVISFAVLYFVCKKPLLPE